MQLHLNTKLLLGFGGALVILLVSTGASLLSIRGLRTQTGDVQRTYQLIQQSDSINALLRDAQTGVRGYRLSGDTAFLRTYNKAVRELPNVQQRVRNLAQDNQMQQQQLDSLQVLISKELNVLRPLANPDASLSQSDLLTALYSDRLTMRAGRQQFARMKTAALRLLDQRLAEQYLFEKATPILVIGSAALAVLLVGWLFFRITRELRDNQRLQTELSAVNTDVAHRISLIRGLAERVVQGDYSVKIDDSGADSLGNLAALLNQMTQSLDQSFESLAQRNRDLDQFAYVASHDLKAPLRGVTTIVKWIEEELAAELSPQLRTYMSQIKGRLARLESLINGLLDYARIGRTAHTAEDVDVAHLVREVAELVVPDHFRLDLRPSLPTLHTSRLELEQVFTNLLSNAVKYHPPGPGHIAISSREVGAFYEFRVQDDGAGIAPEHHQKIFQMFQTLRDRHTAESTGIGLSIVKKIIDEQKGSIRVESAVGQGATFIFTWPK